MRRLIIDWKSLIGMVVVIAIFGALQLGAKKVIQAWTQTGSAECTFMSVIPSDLGGHLKEIRLNCNGKEFTSDDTRLLVYFLDHKTAKVRCDLYDSGNAFCPVLEIAKKK